MTDLSFNLFPTLVLQCPNVISESERSVIFEKLKKRHAITHHAVLGGRSSHAFWKNNKLISSLGLEERIQEKLDEYTKRMAIDNVEIVGSWFNIQDAESTLMQHDHPGSLISASLYINVDENSSSLFFENPNQLSNFVWPKDNSPLSDYIYTYYEFIPKNGEMYIFPSWLKHGSFYNKNQTKDRIAISLNAR